MDSTTTQRRRSPPTRHPLSSRPNSPRDSSSLTASNPVASSSRNGGYFSASTDSASPGYLTPSRVADTDGANGMLRPSSRSPSPGLTPRRRRNVEQQQAVLSTQSQDDEYDPKKRPSGSQYHTMPHRYGSPSTIHANGGPPPTTLDRLESFFGIRNEPPSTTTESLRIPSSRTTSATSSGPPGTRLVLQHIVQGTDTLQAIALRYKTDVATLRKVNGLWPSDSVLSRKILWVPLDRCRELGATQNAAVGIQESDGNVIESTPSALGLLSQSGTGANTPSTSSNLGGGPPPRLHAGTHERGASSLSLNDSEAASSSVFSDSRERSRGPSTSISRDAGSSRSEVAPPVVRRLPSEVLGHFPAAKRSDTHLLVSKGKARADQWNEELVEARPQHRLGAGPGMSGYDPGESGVEDLLQLAREAKSRGSSEVDASPHSVVDEVGRGPTGVEKESESNDTTHESSLVEAEAEKWKPSVWRFGEKRQPSSASGTQDGDVGSSSHKSVSSTSSTSPTSSLRPLKLVEQSIEQWAATNPGSSNKPPSNAATSSYNGWNDIPSLEAYAQGKVTEAYNPSSSRKKKSQRAFFNDLAAGLPANPGQASKWARPIGDSVPSNPSSLRSPPTSSSSNASWKNIFSDTIRGRMPLEEALNKGFEDLFKNQEWSSLPSEEMEHARRLQEQRYGVPRPSQGNVRRKSQHEMNVIDNDHTLSDRNGAGGGGGGKWGW
ncbi:unnamed protein product [Sympodiomycopsis kandeliae]